jgi:DNA-binding NtrC family response regulator
MPQSMQVRFLRVLQEHEIERIGGTQSIPVDFRLICATHRKLEQLVAEGKFREDLFYRINVFPIQLPALRQRLEDIPALTHHFLKRAHGKIGRGPGEVSPQSLTLLQQHGWPGNVRELENVIERACVLAQGPTLLPDHLTWWGQFKPVSRDGAGAPVGVPSEVPLAGVSASRVAEVLPPLPAAPMNVTGIVGPPDGGNGSAAGAGGGVAWDMESDNPLEEAERATLKLVLERCQWNFKKAAERLRLSRSTLYAKVSRYGLQRE